MARAVSGRMSTTAAICHRLGGGVAPAIASVTLVALLQPRIAAIVIAVPFPEPGFVVVEKLKARHPLGALPEVEVRDEQPCRTSVVGWERLPVDLPRDPGLSTGHVGQRKVGGVAGVRAGEHVGLGVRPRGACRRKRRRRSCRASTRWSRNGCHPRTSILARHGSRPMSTLSGLRRARRRRTTTSRSPISAWPRRCAPASCRRCRTGQAGAGDRASRAPGRGTLW